MLFRSTTNPSALTEYLKRKLQAQRAKRRSRSHPAQVEPNVPLERNRTEGRSAGGHQLQNYPHDKRGRRSAQEIHQGTTGERVYSEVQVPLCITLLLYQKEGRKITTYSGLPKAKSIYHQKQVPSTLDTGADLASQRSEPLFKVRHTLGIQQCENQRRRPTQSSIQNQIWAV